MQGVDADLAMDVVDQGFSIEFDLFFSIQVNVEDYIKMFKIVALQRVVLADLGS